MFLKCIRKFLLLSLFSASIAHAIEAITKTGSGTAVSEGNLTILNLHGSWEEMGKQYGELMQSQLIEMDKAFYSKYYDFKIEGVSFWIGKLTNNFFYYAIEHVLNPREKKFLKGASLASGISYQHLVILDLLPYLFTLNEASNSEHCSFIAVNKPLSNTDGVLVGRNMDYATHTKEILNYASLVIFHPTDGSNTVATFGFLGFIPGHTLITKTGVFIESNDASYSSPTDPLSMVYNLMQGKLDVLHRNFYASLDANSVEDVINTLEKYPNLSSSFSGIADNQQVIRLENPAGNIVMSQPKLQKNSGQTKEYNFFTNLYTYSFPTAVLTTSNCEDKTKDSPSYACTRYHNIGKFLERKNKVDIQSIKDFMLTSLDKEGIFQTGESINYPVDEISLQSIICDMSNLTCYYHDFNGKEWRQIRLLDYFNT